jgi:hypothetical protein
MVLIVRKGILPSNWDKERRGVLMNQQNAYLFRGRSLLIQFRVQLFRCEQGRIFV